MFPGKTNPPEELKNKSPNKMAPKTFWKKGKKKKREGLKNPNQTHRHSSILGPVTRADYILTEDLR